MSLKSRYPDLFWKDVVYSLLRALFCCIAVFCALDSTQRNQESDSLLFTAFFALQRTMILQGVSAPWQNGISCFPGVTSIH